MVSLAVVLAILTAIGPVLELNAVGLRIAAPLIQQRLMQMQKPPGRIRGASHYPARVRIGGTNEASPPSCYHFRCSE